jgi:ubiquinone/menaquinone biosynthesis C-methylase UbiE
MTATAKPYKGMGMEGPVARWYAKITQKDMAEFQALAKRLADELPEGSGVLEVAPGPGYLSIELAKFGRYTVTGLDISKTFVEIAHRNASDAGVMAEFRQGNASNMPFADGGFDLIVCRAAFKNFSQPVKALSEMRRVLRTGGRALIIDLRKDTPQETINAHVDHMGLGAASSIMTKLTFRFMLLKRAYTRKNFEDFIAQSGFEKAEIREEPIGFEIWLRK